MSRECVRCVVTFALKKLVWEDPPGCPLHLEGAPIFLRVCVLGQLQHSSLFRPTFPLLLHPHSLTFDRVLTNCSDPSLLKEIVLGEHISVEMIQATEDYDGGRILARFETPADQFLFPQTPLTPGDLRTLTLDKSRRYQHSPQLTLTTSISITKLTVHTPFPTLSPWKPPEGEIPREHSAETATNTRVRREVGVATRDKLRLLLDSYSESHAGQNGGDENLKLPCKKLGTLKFSENHGKSKVGGRKFQQRTLGGSPAHLYHCLTADIGPHDWTTCPRRSFRGVQKSRAKSAPSLELVGGPGGQNSGPHTHRPFVVGRVGSGLLGRRDFCGQQLPEEKMGERGGEGVSGEGREIGGGVRCEGERVWTRAGAAVSSCVRDRETSHSQYRSRMERDSEYHGPILSVPHKIQDTVAAAASVHDSSDTDDAVSTAGSESGSSCESHVTGSDDEGEESPALSEDCITCDHNSPTQTPTHVSSKRQRHKLLSKYLCHWSGNQGTGASPAGLIEHKLQTLIRDFCECRRSAESLGRDGMSEDDERLRASLSAEREDLLNKSAKLMPEKSVLVGLGGDEGRDFWSHRLAEFQGKHHRLVFSETMEKIYSRLYHTAVNMK